MNKKQKINLAVTLFLLAAASVICGSSLSRFFKDLLQLPVPIIFIGTGLYVLFQDLKS